MHYDFKNRCPHLWELVQEILDAEFSEIGFPTLGSTLPDQTDTATIPNFLRELGSSTRWPGLKVGDSTALILSDLLRRGTDDIDIVNEAPAVLRSQHDLLNQLTARHGLKLTHFQSHYLPSGCEKRLNYLERFGELDVYPVDPLDIFVGKLFSKRVKDLDDLKMLVKHFAKQTMIGRIKDAAMQLLADPQLHENGKRNGYIRFGDPLPA